MESLEQRIADIVRQAVSFDDQLFLVDIVVKGNTGNQKVLIFIDGDEGINIDTCGKVSREVGSVLEEEDFMPGKYLLEVAMAEYARQKELSGEQFSVREFFDTLNSIGNILVSLSQWQMTGNNGHLRAINDSN